MDPLTDQRNVLGGELAACCDRLDTGFLRTGRCDWDERDVGAHVVCARMTAEFLEFSASRGNDLSTPHPELDFPGLLPGDRWCLCAARWSEALQAGVAPPVYLQATHERALKIIGLADLKRHAADLM